MDTARSFSIITTCMDRLEDLKRTLPRMIEQDCAEVIVVDFSCPQGTGAYVAKHLPSVRVVSVDGQKFFSNWTARNAGAAVATSDTLLFSDLDIILAKDAVAWIADNLPDNTLGHFKNARRPQFNKQQRSLAMNQLKGFHVVPTAKFREVGGYDDVPQGYAAGADTDLEVRLSFCGVQRYELPDTILEGVIEQDLGTRTKHHALKIAVSYCASQLYRSVKLELLRITRRFELPRKLRAEIYRRALEAARNLSAAEPIARISVDLHDDAIPMPKQLGFAKARRRVSLNVEISGNEPPAGK